MNRLAKSSIAAVAVALISLAAQADGDVSSGKKLAYTCLGCHGIEHYKNAYPKYSVPKLGGQNEAYIVTALDGYKSGTRWHPTMRGYSSALTDQDRADLAAYFSAAAPKIATAAPAGTAPEQATTCVACHGQSGVSTMAEYPNIAGQHADYLAQALNDYRLGKRRNPIMQGFAAQLSREDIVALAEFYAAQKGLATPKFD